MKSLPCLTFVVDAEVMTMDFHLMTMLQMHSWCKCKKYTIEPVKSHQLLF